jgi:dTDP-4-dehydrorhamnose reductase
MGDDRAEPPMRCVLLFGGSGQVGRQLLNAMAALGKVVAPTRAEADLTDPGSLREVIARLTPAIVINCAAVTNVDQAEREPALARAVNEIAPGVMAKASRDVGAVFVHYSTDYVFDGAATEPYNEESRPNPINIYGASKLGGEQRISEAGGPHLIIRTSWVYSATGTGFVATLLRELPTKDTIRVVADQVGSPTWSYSLACATTAILRGVITREEVALDRKDWGIYHLAGSGAGSRVEIAEALIGTLSALGENAPRPRIVPISSAEFAAAAPRPHYSALSNNRAARRFGVALDPWRDELRRMLMRRSA